MTHPTRALIENDYGVRVIDLADAIGKSPAT